MLMPSPARGDAASRRLQAIYKALNADDRRSLLDFAEFLASREPAVTADLALAEPVHEPRPAQESVVQAIKRLRRVYHMVDRATLLHETSDLMTQHLMQGRAAAAVIDDLEVLFERRYQALLPNDAGGRT